MKAKTFWNLLKESYAKWTNDNCPRLAAALSYYALFSIAPLLIVTTTVVSMIFGEQAVRSQVDEQMQQLIGRHSADFIHELVKSANKPASGPALIISTVVLFAAAGSVFVQIQDSLDTIWGVALDPHRSLMQMIKGRVFAFSMVLVAGLLLLSSVVISIALSAGGKYVASILPGSAAVWQFLDVPISFALIFVLFALIYRALPNVNVEWRHVWLGALLADILFAVGRYGISFYLGHAKIESSYGAAGSMIGIMIWTYYSAQIFFLGAELTAVTARQEKLAGRMDQPELRAG